jgi:hypothetical protein
LRKASEIFRTSTGPSLVGGLRGLKPLRNLGIRKENIYRALVSRRTEGALKAPQKFGSQKREQK